MREVFDQLTSSTADRVIQLSCLNPVPPESRVYSASDTIVRILEEEDESFKSTYLSGYFQP
jgi:hypothetical protein